MQKKYTLLATACLCSLFSFSQFKKGTAVVDFNFGNLNNLSLSDNSSNYSNKNISYNAAVGYFIKQNWEVGVGINYNRVRNSSYPNRDFSQKSNGWGLDAYTNYYFGSGKLKPYLTLHTGWENNQGSYYLTGIKNNINRDYFYYRIGGGLNYNISQKFALFVESSYKNNSPFTRNSQSSFYLTFGGRFFFNRTKKHSPVKQVN